MPGMPLGSWERAALMAACTSRAASSTLRSRSKRRLTVLCPWMLTELISVMPAMVPSARSSGVATVAAMDSGLAPGMRACTWIDG